MVLGKEVAIFDWEWGRNSAPREGQKIPCIILIWESIFGLPHKHHRLTRIISLLV